MSTRLSLFNSPLLLGFDHFERALDRVSKASAEGYPPYNVEQVAEDKLRITLAVAGFSAEELSIQIEDNQLVIRGKQADQPDRVYLHRGIAARQFQRSFVLAEGIEVTGAQLENGLLHIDLVRPEPRSKTRTIAINSADRPDQPVLQEPEAQAGGSERAKGATGERR
jgi:HSP20 family molecular chaperone IbpA